MKLFYSIVLLLVLIPSNSIASLTTSLTPSDSVKCFPIDKAKTLLIYANKGLLLDSLTALYENEIQTLDAIIDQKDSQLALAQGLIESQSNKIIQLEKREKWLWVGLGVSALAILILAIF